MGISLEKGQKISLSKSGGGTLTSVRMGLGWDVAKKKGLFNGSSIDLDASCLLFSGSTNVDTVYYRQLTSKDGSIRHTGDNRTGAGEGDDESIVVDLTSVPDSVDTLVFTVNSFSGQSFDRVENASCRLVDSAVSGEPELARYDLSSSGSHKSIIMAKLTREGGGWAMTAIGQNSNATRIDELAKQVVSAL